MAYFWLTLVIYQGQHLLAEHSESHLCLLQRFWNVCWMFYKEKQIEVLLFSLPLQKHSVCTKLHGSSVSSNKKQTNKTKTQYGVY